MSSFWLRITEPGLAPRVVTLDGGVDVGRDCDGVVLDDPTVSRCHLRLEPADDGLTVTDLGSANGTIVDGERLDTPRIVGAGTTINLGETELLVVEGRETSSSTTAEGAVTSLDARPSAEARRLSAAASKSHRRGPSGR